MTAADLLVLPVGCLLCGLLAASAPLLRSLPWLHPVVRALHPYQTPIGLVTVLAALLSLLFPAHGPPLLGSLFPAAIGVVVGLALSLEALLDIPLLKRHRRGLAWVGNALLYLKTPLGLLSVMGGIFHFCFPSAPFF